MTAGGSTGLTQISVAIATILSTSFVSQAMAQEQADDIAEVTVTGSRIARSTLNTPTPTMVIDSESLERSGSNAIGDALIKVPAIGVGLGLSNANLNADAGASFVNLRGLGTERTLVLINGRRRVSGTAQSSAVDLTTIPSSLIERIDVITGGASAVYGADAVTGVVNVILKKNVEGLHVTGNVGQSESGGADTYSIGLLGGSNIGDGRGSASFGVSYGEASPLPWSKRRGFGPGLIAIRTNPDNTGPNDGIPDLKHYANSKLTNLDYGGSFVQGGVRYHFDPDLEPMQFDSTPFGPTNTTAIGGDGWEYTDFNELRVGYERISANTYVNYELTDSLNFFLEGDFANSPVFVYGKLFGI